MSIAEKFEKITDAVYEKGKKDEYDKFWDNFQDYGNRKAYGTYLFYGKKWNDGTFYPKYDLTLTDNCLGVFNANAVTNIKQRLIDCNVKLNTSGATNLTSIFNQSKTTTVPAFDVRNAPNSTHLFYSASQLVTIDKIILNENNVFSNWFHSCFKLENLTIEGTIGKNEFDVKDCTKLSGKSIVSIIEALATTTEGLTVTLSQTAVNNIKFTDYDDEGFECLHGKEGTYYSWDQLAQSRTNWTISLV